MPAHRYRSQPSFPLRSVSSNAYVTSAVGMEETQGHVRARRSSLFTHTVIWVTGLVCLAFLLGSLAQAWTNSQLMQTLATTQQQAQQTQATHDALQQQASHYQNPAVIEQEAREQFGYVRPGEHAVVIVGAKSQGQASASHPAKSSPPEGFWLEWWSIFFG
jgi:cell division protein FtsB